MIVGLFHEIDEGSTTMAERKRMTADEVVSYLLEEDGADFLRESLKWVVQQLMEAEVSELIGAERGERSEDRLTHRNGYRGPALGHVRRRDRAGDPEAAPRQLLPDLPRAREALRAGAGGGGPGGPMSERWKLKSNWSSVLRQRSGRP